MSNDAITIHATTLRQAPPSVRSWLSQALGLATDTRAGIETGEQTKPELEAANWGLARLSTIEARRIVEGVSDRTLKVLRAIADLEPRFLWADLARKVKIPIDDDAPLRGVFAGLTKRTRTVTGNSKVGLLYWPNFDELSWEEAVGMMDPETHAAFRRVFEVV